jgi:hypothetical protein
MLRIGRYARADADREALRVAELDRFGLEAGTQPIHRGDDLVRPGAGPHDQELVRTVPRDVAVLPGHQRGDPQEDLVGGGVAVGVVEEPEVVDVDQRHADATLARARGLDLVGQEADDRSVVEHPGQCVAARRLDELAVLPAEPCLRGAEHQEEDAGQEHRRGERDEHDVAAGRVEPRHEVGGVAPHRDDRENFPVAVLDRQVLLHHARRVRQRPGAVERRARLDERGSRVAGGGGARVGGDARIGPDESDVVAEEDLAAEVADLDADDSVALGQGAQPLAELANASTAPPVGCEVVGTQLAVDEELDQGGVAVDDPAERRVGEVVGCDGHERAGGHADEHEHHTEDECEEHRSPPIAAFESSAKHVHAPYERRSWR